VPHPAKPGQRATKVWQVPATTNAIIELAEQLAGQGIQRVVVESTSDYWRPFVRHEVPRVRAEVKGLRRRPVAAGR
jgi:acyl-CoA thioesterase FadM